jgi:glucokinase
MILVGDIGGTRTRLALATRGAGGWELGALEERPTTPDVPGAIHRFLGAQRGTRPRAAAFCGAGIVSADGSIQLTNTDVRLEPVALAAAAGVEQAILINDFGAIATAVPHLPAAALVKCGGGSPLSTAPVVVLGPGTGLGIGIATPGPAGWVTIAGDGGHADLAPVDDEQLDIWRKLRAAHGRVSAETVLCGPGLERLYAAAGDGSRRRVEEIDAEAWSGGATAVRTIALFTRWLGSVAGNLALTAGARGGIYLAGGILPRWGKHFDAALFRRAFEDKPPHVAWLREIPSYVVTHPQPGLLGLAALAESGA